MTANLYKENFIKTFLQMYFILLHTQIIKRAFIYLASNRFNLKF
jgi:hypothetical protein